MQADRIHAARLRDFSGVYTSESLRILPSQNLFHMVIKGYKSSTCDTNFLLQDL